jgi:hypothetical protein
MKERKELMDIHISELCFNNSERELLVCKYTQ